MADDATRTGEPRPSEDPADRAGSTPADAPETRRRNPIVAVGVVLVLAALVAGGIWFQTSRSDDASTAAGPDATTELVAAPVDAGMSFATGAGPVVDVYVDYQCPHCADLDEVIGPELARIVAAEEAELVLRPVKFLSRASGRGAASLYCAADAGKAYEMHQQLLEDISADFSPEGLTAMAGVMGLDEAAFGTCLADQATTVWVNGVTDGARADGIQGIPAVFVDGTRLSDAELASGPAFRNAVLADGA